jgi:hypothetical protein
MYSLDDKVMHGAALATYTNGVIRYVLLSALQRTHNIANRTSCRVCLLRLHCNAGVETVERRSLHSVRYSIPKTAGMSLARVFRELESAKRSIGIAEYSVGQQTLESIFNSFAARQDIADAEQQQ